MAKFAIDIFADAAARFEAAQAEVLQEWQLGCGCEAPGLRPECHTCTDCQQLRVLTQQKLSATPEADFPGPFPLKRSHSYSLELQAKAVEMYNQGCPLKDIQAATGVRDRETIRQWARRMNAASQPTVYSPEVREQCLRLYQSGEILSTIEKTTKVPRQVLLQWITEAKILRRVNNQHSDSVKERCLQLRKEGKSYTEIQDLTGVSKNTVIAWFRKQGPGSADSGSRSSE